MPLTLEQYATWLDGRDLPWPAPPKPDPVKARPHLAALNGIRAVLWNVYGTLLAIPFGELVFEHPQPFVMSMALEKTIAEFKMWASMSRKPGAPSEYMLHLYKTQLDEQRLAPSPGEKYPEMVADRLWEGLIKKLFQKDYTFDAGFYGSLNEFSRKVAYFFHASLQGTTCYPGAAAGRYGAVADSRAGAGLVRRRAVVHGRATPARPGRRRRRLATRCADPAGACRCSRTKCAAKNRRNDCSARPWTGSKSTTSVRPRCCTSARGSIRTLLRRRSSA